MNVVRVAADRRRHLRVHRGAEGEVSADADAHHTHPAGPLLMGGESGEGSLGIGVVAAEFLGRLELVAAIRAVLILD